MELVRRAQAGDREAFEMLVERHATETYRLAAAIVGETDARDIAQEAFVTAWQQLPRLRNPDAFALAAPDHREPMPELAAGRQPPWPTDLAADRCSPPRAR